MVNFILVHGAWHTSKIWNRITPLLTKQDHHVVTPQLPSSGVDAPANDFEPDVKVIRETVVNILQRGEDVIIVAHSYAAIPVGTAIEGLDAKSRRDFGESGAVVRLIFLDAFVQPEGAQVCPTGEMPQMGPSIIADEKTGWVTVTADFARNGFYSDISDEVASELVADLQPQSLGAFWGKTTFAAWKYIPSTYILCTKSHDPDGFRALLQRAKSTPGHMIEKEIEIATSHTPMISQPEMLAEIILKEAESM